MKAMKATNKSTTIRTAAAALALFGLLPTTATDSDAAKLNRGGTSLNPAILEKADPGRNIFTPHLPPPPPPPPLPMIAALDGDGRLLVFGTEGADDLEILIDDTGANRVYVYSGNQFLGSWSSSPMKRMAISLKGGDDTYFIGLKSGASHKFEKDIEIALGSGNDSGFVDFRGNGGNTIVLGSLDVTVHAGAGDDETYAHFAQKHGGKLDFTCNMGSGADDCSANMWGDVTGSADVSFNMKGGGGKDSLFSWNTYDQKTGQYSDIRITGDSTLLVRMDGGSKDDILTPTFAGEADGKLTMTLKGQGGNDSSFGKVNLGNGSHGSVKLRTTGQSGSDDLRLDVNGASPFLSAVVNGGTSTDICQGTPNVTLVNCP